MNRKESAAATRGALIDQAAQLLDGGGLEAVTLREVGARAGVSRGAPYRHFADKDGLLTAVAADGWERLADAMVELRADAGLSPLEKVRTALAAVVTMSRRQPHLYRLMFRPPEGDPSAVFVAAQRMCEEFQSIVDGIADQSDAERYAAMLLTGVHGAVGLEMGGLLQTDKWQTTAEELAESLVALVHDAARRGLD
ncbi:TetR/AcrR family transcriptional regulator [Mycolicibacterium neoaurum]|uniref:TetR/AcrR family transcriptional regulator n=1 Tax=Mycolicibacterium neoaurum TaxID=1795 RepID=UPI00248BA374|nr:TetR/AcrR family transcriptional regulator [Mycolicibacterium neoaurum]WBP95679.1 TetR/AcrR family transcriptional regulator [Mycolicibacterium neoaurum]WBS09361.1 TetR/AcrR family transcriptional regulator [Mycolicibacterium neoaurum]